jgi:glycosyltransferase involved in cell wall biosynthesis
MAVVAPATPTIRDIFRDGSEVLLFRQDDAGDLVKKLCDYLDNRELMEKTADTLQQKIMRSYSETITFEFYNQLIRKE